MNKKTAIFLTLSVVFILYGNYLFFYSQEDREQVRVVKAIDGDTLEIEDGRRLRLVNINTPEKNERNSDKALDFMQGFENKTIFIENLGTEKYGRTLVRAYSDRYINLEIVERGYAHMFLVDDKELEEFTKAQEIARNGNLGIWERSKYHGCMTAEINKKDEYMDILNECPSLQGWVVKDESTKRYVFKSDMPDKFRLYSGKGEDNKQELYWNAGSVWNNDRDEVFILDKDGFLVYSDIYGY